MFGRCHWPIWRSDDFSYCFRHDYLQTLLPLVICALTFIYLLVTLWRKAYNSKYYHAYRLLNHWSHVWDFKITPHVPEQEDEDTSDSSSEITEIDDEIQRNARLALHPTVSNIDRTTFVEADKPRGQTLNVIVEAALSLGEVGIGIALLLQTRSRSKAELSAIAHITVWAYTSLLILSRLIITASQRLSFPTLWYLTAFIYGFRWIPTALVFRSYLIHPPSILSRNYMIADFALNSSLLVIALASRAGNKAVQLEHEGDIPPPREPVASLFSLATFTWVDQIVWTGYRKTTELSDVWNLPPEDKAAAVLAQYRQVKRASALAWHLLSYFKMGLLIQAAWAAFSGVLTFAPTLLLKAILEYVEDPRSIPRNSAWFYVILLFVSGCVTAVADGMALWIGRKICIRFRAIIIGELYGKALKRKVGSAAEKVLGESSNSKSGGNDKGWWQRLKGKFSGKKKAASEPTKSKEEAAQDEAAVSSGAIINLMAVDSFKVADLTAYLHFLWANTPVQVVIAVVLLYAVLGYSSIAGIGAMIVLLPVNMFISKRFASIQKRILAATDARIHTTNEVLSNIRIIKLFAWEHRFLESVNETRKKELAFLRTRYVLWAIAATIWGGVPIIITFLSFAVYTFVEGKDLIPSVAFTALSLFQILRIPLDQLADMVAHVQEAKVSIDRIEEYLVEEDTQKYEQLKHSRYVEDECPRIGFEKASFAWGSKSMVAQDMSSTFRMINLDLAFAVGHLNVIAGPTGSGKTSLLMALLGEMTKIEGSVYLPGARSREDVHKDPSTGLTETVAYCAQQAWLVNDTVKQNIVFASPWDGKRYKQVIEACSLKKDFEILDNGDETLVGEKGVALSGGQKQRISLARAIYSNARHLLLDDILSAVDAHTSKWIFENALLGPLMSNRTCLLVTHNVTLCLPVAQFVVLLDNGRVTTSGTVQDILKSGKLRDDLLQSATGSRATSRPESPTPQDGSNKADDQSQPNGKPAAAVDKDTLVDGPVGATETPRANAMSEGKAEGSVKFSILFMYFKSMGGPWFWATAAFAFAAQQVSQVSTNVWIRAWANAYAQREYGSSSVHQTQGSLMYAHGFGGFTSCITGSSCTWSVPWWPSNISSVPQQSTLLPADQHPMSFLATTFDTVDAGYYLGVYAILGAIYMLITFCREFLLFVGSLTASDKIHRRLMEAVCGAKFRFFDSTPLGQIMNRFSKDVENIDQEIAPVAVGVVYTLANIVTIVILISVITPGFLVAGVFITILYFLIGTFYIHSSRDLKRIESVQRSPLYQQFGETLAGMVTIRAYGDERRFIRENLKMINTHNRPFIYLWAANRWLALRVDVVGAMVSFFAGVFVLLNVGRIDAGAAGLAMTYAVSFTENVLWFVRLYSANEQNMNSVERVKEYLDVEQEAPATIPETEPPGDWPSNGEVEFKNYTTRYKKELEPVLRDLTFKIAPCEKVGVVGRTGAGKSSLALALFRALEAEEGSIHIDGVDISKIGLRNLRENIVMVPQDPTLFSGTIRSNLDPFGLFTDEEIFNALRGVQLIGSTPPGQASPTHQDNPVIIRTDPDSGQGSSDVSDETSDTAVETQSVSNAENKNIFWTLSSPISESGSNLSQGQRQLLCLARAMLKSPKVLLMDEATASIDYATDAKIQETIRELKNNTIITIAHRLKTIIDYDRVIVMERGRVVEYGDPWTLIKPEGETGSTGSDIIREEGKRWFRDMCEQSGDLAGLAEEAHKSWKAKRLVDDS